jgi:hypothetical protein
VGLDIYAGPVSRYVAGDWKTIVQQAGEAAGTPVIVMRHNEPSDRVTDVNEVAKVIATWRQGLIRSLGLNEEWDEDVAGEYYTDKPDWDGYGAVVLMAAYDEQPSLAPGSKVRRLLGSSVVPAVAPRQYSEAQAFKAAAPSPMRYPTILTGAQWCLPLVGGPTVFRAPSPNGTPLTMGHVSRLAEELALLNQRTLRLSAADMESARRVGPPKPGSSVDATAPFGFSVLTAVADFAAAHRVAWIMDY